MSSNPYIRPGLEASHANIPDPGIEVQDWIDRLGDLLDGQSLQAGAHHAYDLMALWAKLKRVRPELLAEHDGDAYVSRGELVLREKDVDFAKLAFTIPNTGAWLQEAQSLALSYEELIDPVQRAELAENLLADLDDAELAMYAAKQVGLTDVELQRELETCSGWVSEHADLFLAAGVYVQAVGMALRSDLAQWDSELARTAEKYVQVLDAQEIAEAELSFADQPPVDRAVVQYLFSFARKKSHGFAEVLPIRGTHRWFEWPESIRMGALTAGPSPELVYLDWCSEDGRYKATLAFDPQGTGPVRINFYQEDGIATSLAGEQAVLADVMAEKTIDLQGNADFARDALWQARSRGQPLTLQVGSGFWTPVQTSGRS